MKLISTINDWVFHKINYNLLQNLGPKAKMIMVAIGVIGVSIIVSIILITIMYVDMYIFADNIKKSDIHKNIIKIPIENVVQIDGKMYIQVQFI